MTLSAQSEQSDID